MARYEDNSPIAPPEVQRDSLLDWLHLQLLKVPLNLMQGSVRADDDKCGTQHPENSSSSTSEPEEGERNSSSQAVLIGHTQFPTKQNHLGLEGFQVNNVTGSKENSQGNEQHGAGDNAVEDEAHENEDVIALEVFHIPRHPLAHIAKVLRPGEASLVNKVVPWADVSPAPVEPVLGCARTDHLRKYLVNNSSRSLFCSSI